MLSMFKKIFPEAGVEVKEIIFPVRFLSLRNLQTYNSTSPDYSKKQSVSVNFIAPANGYLIIENDNNKRGSFSLSINNVIVWSFQTSDGFYHMQKCGIVPIAKGQKITSSNYPIIYFIPGF